MWLATAPGIVAEESLELTFAGGVRTCIVSVNGGELVAAPVPGAGGQSIAGVTLEAGLNTVCVHVVEGAAAQLAEARNFIAVALVPE